MPSPKSLKLSVIIPSYHSQKTIERCLRSLVNQLDHQTMEIIVIDSSGDETAAVIRKNFPGVKVYAFPERKFPGEARNFGIAKSQGELLAFIDADCLAQRHWLQEIIHAHQAGAPSIGGVIDNGNPESYVGWGHYFCEFSQWMVQSPAGPMTEIPTCCLSLKRWAFEQYGPFVEGSYCSDTAFHWKLGQAGYQALLVPAIQVAHLNLDEWSLFLRHEFEHGRSFAAVRVVEQDFSWGRRMLYSLAAPLLPLVLFSRVARRVWQKQIYFKQLVLAAPVVLLGLAAWSTGEFVGYVSRKARQKQMPMDQLYLCGDNNE